MEARWYLRCTVCLSVSVVEGLPPPSAALCAACDGRIEVLGRVTRHDRLLVGTALETPCDDRCTAARGPKCECPCGAKNHGTGLVVQVEVTTGIPRVAPLAPEQARARAAEYRAQLVQTRQAVDAKHVAGRLAAEAHSQGHWVAEYSAMRAYWRALQQIRAAAGLKTHKGRIKALQVVAV